LTSFASQNGGQISDLIDSSFTPILSKMLMLQGFDYPTLVSHHHSCHFGNWHRTGAGDEGNPSMATIDIVLANYFASQGLPGELVTYTASYRDIQLGMALSWPEDGSYPTSTFYDPATLWTKYFENGTIPTNIKELLVDRVYEDYKSLQSNARLGAE